MTDPISDFLTRIRNASKARHRVIDIPSSGIKKNITKILHEQGYILSYKFFKDEQTGHDFIKVALKYDPLSGIPAFKKLQRISKPGLRKYAHTGDLPRVINGLGVAIISTSKGVMTDKEARRAHVGGEVICYVY